MDTTFLLFAGLLFAAVMLLVWGVAAAWSAHRDPETERIARRLRAVIGGDARESDVTIVKQRRLSASPELEALLRHLPAVRKLDRMLLQALSNSNGLEPGLADNLLREAQQAMERQSQLGLAPVLVVQHPLRVLLARFLRRSLPDLKVLSHAEIPDTRTIKVTATIGAKA